MNRGSILYDTPVVFDFPLLLDMDLSHAHSPTLVTWAKTTGMTSAKAKIGDIAKLASQADGEIFQPLAYHSLYSTRDFPDYHRQRPSPPENLSLYFQKHGRIAEFGRPRRAGPLRALAQQPQSQPNRNPARRNLSLPHRGLAAAPPTWRATLVQQQHTLLRCLKTDSTVDKSPTVVLPFLAPKKITLFEEIS